MCSTWAVVCLYRWYTQDSCRSYNTGGKLHVWIVVILKYNANMVVLSCVVQSFRYYSYGMVRTSVVVRRVSFCTCALLDND